MTCQSNHRAQRYRAQRICRSKPISISCLSMICLSVLLAPVQAQFTDRPLAGDVAQQRIEQLRLDDSVIRSEISSAQVARQAEIARLEGRILQLEEQIRDLPSVSGSQQLAFILGLAETEPSDRKETTVQVTNDDDVEAGKSNPPRVDPSAVHVSPVPITKESAPAAARLLSSVVQEIVVRDFIMSVEIELLDARTRALEKSREVKSLERLSSKGLASASQLELQVMQRRRAELQVGRLEKQLAGLRRVYPSYFD